MIGITKLISYISHGFTHPIISGRSVWPRVTAPDSCSASAALSITHESEQTLAPAKKLAQLQTWLSSFMLLTALLLALFMMGPAHAAKANLLKTSYFTADLGTSWQTVGTIHNNAHSVNINFVNRSAQSTLNVVVGSGKIQPYALLVDMQKALRQQNAKVGPIDQHGSLLFFEFTLNGLGGFSCSASNGTDVSSITILGNPQAGLNFIRKFRDKDIDLFPDI